MYERQADQRTARHVDTVWINGNKDKSGRGEEVEGKTGRQADRQVDREACLGGKEGKEMSEMEKKSTWKDRQVNSLANRREE